MTTMDDDFYFVLMFAIEAIVEQRMSGVDSTWPIGLRGSYVIDPPTKIGRVFFFFPTKFRQSPTTNLTVIAVMSVYIYYIMYSDVLSSSPVSYFCRRCVRFGLQQHRLTYFTSNMWVTPFFSYSVFKILARCILRFPPLCRFSEIICKIKYNIIISRI